MESPLRKGCFGLQERKVRRIAGVLQCSESDISLLDPKLNTRQALKHGGDQQYLVYDSRAAVYERLGKQKDSLRDAKKVIELAPNRWQGYARAARIFLGIRRADQSLTMVDMALERTKPDDTRRRAEFLKLKEEAEEYRRRCTYHLGKMPVELLTEVFTMVAVENHTDVLLVSRISRHWRNVALNTPALWSTLVLSKRDPVRKSQWWIKRSKGRIRELCLRNTLHDRSDWSFKDLRGMQWSRLRICRLEDWDLFRYLEQISMTSILSELEELDINDETKYPQVSKDPLLLPDAKLRSLTLRGAVFSLDAIHSRLSNLTSLTICKALTIHALKELHSTLVANPMLQTLILDTIPNLQPHTPDSPLTMHHVTRLEVSGLPGGSSATLLQLVGFPALQELSMARLTTGVDLLFDNLRAGTGVHITRLSLVLCRVTTSHFLDFLKLANRLESLTLTHLPNTANPVVEALTTPTSDPLMCPALKHLNVAHCSDVQTGPLLRLVKSRLQRAQEGVLESAASGSTEEDRVDIPPPPVVPQIASLIVDGCPRIEAEFLPWFRKVVPIFSCVYETKKASGWRR